MKHIISYAILLVLIGILFYLHFADGKTSMKADKQPASEVTGEPSAIGKIAYIDVDSLQNNCKYYEQIKADLEKKEKNAEAEIVSLQKKFQSRAAELQQKASQMSQKEQESAMMEINKMQQDFQTKQQNLHQGLADYNQKVKDEMLEKIETFLKGYNRDGKYSYVFSYEPGFMFYKDSTLDITKDVIKGLNDSFEKEKK